MYAGASGRLQGKRALAPIPQKRTNKHANIFNTEQIPIGAIMEVEKQYLTKKCINTSMKYTYTLMHMYTERNAHF